jgi:ribosomal protein L35
MKPNKSYLKRLRVTKNGKILARRSGQNHFNAKENRRSQLAKKRPAQIQMSKKAISRYQLSN